MRGKATGSSCVKLNSQDHPRVCGEKPERKAPRRPRLGSPPRMRGKETDSRRQCCSAGITPAYAGKRTLFCLAGRRNRDHPRVCGEKKRTVADNVAPQGSPPRMRGKERYFVWQEDGTGITPAYAGKSIVHLPFVLRVGDHPRVCGEKGRTGALDVVQRGSPPRMRGKAFLINATASFSGITPAYAGKSILATDLALRRRDHPRVCGEKFAVAVAPPSAVGSPPRMRGKAEVEAKALIPVRITPAYAGKRGTGCQASEQTGDHPRVCGEKAPTLTSTVAPAGSPPRMRGKDHDGRGAAKYRGITPAYAGKSQRESWPHPA